jgi:hypothetical protein
MFQSRRIVLATLLASIAVLPTRASGPVFWTVANAAEFLKGTSDGVFVSLEGVLSPGPGLTNRLTSAPAQIWSIAESSDGTIWAGTGGDGRVLRLRGTQPEQTVFDADESNIFALAVSGNRVYAASSPDGRVYVLDGDAPPRAFFDPAEKYIWALAVDGSGRLWVGAGNPAVVYRVDSSGTGQAIYKPPAAHVVALSRDSQGRLLAGTESPGRLYRFSADDRPFALLDSGLTEVRAIASAPDGSLYAAAVTRGDDSSGSSGDQAPIVASVATVTATPASGSGSTAAPPTRRSILYRIDSSGAWEPVWETPDTIYDLSVGDDGALAIATGPDGRLYRLERGREVLLLTGVDAKQIVRFAGPARAGARAPAFGTANPGRVMTAGSADAPAAFISGVRDTKSLSSWGLIRWVAGGPVALYTRSGNTDKPDDSWSPWSGPYARREGETIQSPPARFLQWRAVFTRGAQPSQLTSVTVAYLPRNTRPVVSSLTVHPPGVVFQRPFSSEDGAIAGLDDATADARRPPGDAPQPPSPGRRMFQKGLQTFAWKADDADGDRLLYSIQYRREGETAWRELKTGLSDPLFVWDTTTVADGRYLLRVRASDSPTNSAERVLAGERESDPFEIDNTPPQLTIESARQGATIRVTVRVRDTQTPVLKLEYSTAGANWQVAYPIDGLTDSLDERYEITLPADTDLARVVVRATDLLQNVSSAVVTAR